MIKNEISFPGKTVGLDRRTFLGRLLGTAALGSLVGGVPALAQQADAPAAEGAPAATPAEAPFSFDTLTEMMRAESREAPVEVEKIGNFLAELDYDEFQRIRFDPDRTRWADNPDFHMNAFHLGWLFKEPVHVYEIIDGQARPMSFSTADFIYSDLKTDVPADFEMSGVAGIRLMTPLNRADKFDELVSFLGASYFRALGRGTVYGLSARGLAVNTGRPEGEEFPRFSDIWLERPANGTGSVTLYAALRSASVTGAYRFVIRPGETTEMDVTARLFLRKDIRHLGIAPLTSMYLFGGADPGAFDDFRPAVHDSEALVLNTASGETFYRPLNNPPQLASSFLGAQSPASFGLVQRDRAFQTYLDAEAHYDQRPSVIVKPLNDWGQGSVSLLEIPSDLEVNDNIVAMWVPNRETKAGEELEFSYRLYWGLAPEGNGSPDLARVLRTRVGKGGVSGVDGPSDRRKFVVDFAGGTLAELSGEAEVAPNVSIQNGEVVETVLSRIEDTGSWRLVIEARAADGAVVEMKASLEGYGHALSETWLYQWVNK
ncbi:glucan biosynthesis protein [Tropicimonas sediminicola]|uniref:Glucans biosynthesis protein G n=1 Tax=Tropicimonas sediminicola TaxID=1031541 RepID=A0A239F2N8_9RHOB|nr:glucan biosynthesis protein G [Tropicimonas sediminicola]SNS50808.1 glucans biosynthesis protein [Tropicimonas sediminicola]